MGVFDRLKAGLSRTADQIVRRLDEIVRGADSPERRSRALDVETLEALEDVLISADLGVPATERILAAVRKAPRDGRSLRDLVRDEILAVFADTRHEVVKGHPHVVLIVGVNGTGKTSTVGKLASLA